jgi:hypothetical protein
VARRVDDEVGLDGDGVDAREFPRQRVDRRPVHHDAGDAVVLADDDVRELRHILDFRAGVAGGADQGGTRVRAVGEVQFLGVGRLLVRDVEFVEDAVGGRPDRELVHQEAAEPEAAAEVVVLLDDHHVDVALGEFLRGDEPRRPAADDDDLRVGVLEELLAPRLGDRCRDLRVRRLAETIERHIT